MRSRSHWLGSHELMIIAVGAFAVLGNVQKALALTIIRDFIGGVSGTNNIGAGNLVDIFNAAADIWEQAILDDHVLTLHYGWDPNVRAEHRLSAQGGTPNRETEGTILFNGSGLGWYLDPTPRLNEEFEYYIEAAQDMGSGVLNVSRIFRGSIGDPGVGGGHDLLTSALHEIGHALGMSGANTSYITEVTDFDIDITDPLPFAGMAIPVYGAHFANDLADRIMMNGSYADGERGLPTALDIIALAQLSRFTKLNLNLSPNVTIASSGSNAIVSWLQSTPGFALEESTTATQGSNWQTVQHPVLIANGAYFVTQAATGSTKFFRLNRSTNFVLTVSAISQNPPDVNPDAAGVQAYAGSTPQYSVSVSDPNESPSFGYVWLYSVNGGPELGYENGGGGPVISMSFTYGNGDAGSTYAWRLWVLGDQNLISANARLTVHVEAPPVPPQGLTIPAPLGTISGPFIVTNGCICQTSETSVAAGGRAAYNFVITNAGNYVISATVNAPNNGANSVFLNIDAEPQDPFMISDILPLTSGFQPRTLSWRGNGTFDNNEFVPKVFSLDQGPHQLIIRGREGNTQLESITIVPYP